MSEFFIYSKQYQDKRGTSKKRNHRQAPNIYEMGVSRDNSYYQKVIEDYEEFKRISKNKLHESREDASSLDFHGKFVIYFSDCFD